MPTKMFAYADCFSILFACAEKGLRFRHLQYFCLHMLKNVRIFNISNKYAYGVNISPWCSGNMAVSKTADESSILSGLVVRHGSVAQLVEHRSFKPRVVGSSPTRPMNLTCFFDSNICYVI